MHLQKAKMKAGVQTSRKARLVTKDVLDTNDLEQCRRIALEYRKELLRGRNEIARLRAVLKTIAMAASQHAKP